MLKKIGFKKGIFIFVAVALAVLLGAFIFNVYQAYIRVISDDMNKQLKAVQGLFEKQLSSDIKTISMVIEMLSQNPDIRAAWLARDRTALLNLASPLLTDFRSKYQITHFYFHEVNRVNFLRVYKPEKYGDIINRHVLLEAENTGQTSSGLEHGLFGSFTLRVVYPWRIDGRLAGYIEMGEEIDQIVTKLHDILGVEIYVSIYKEYLNRNNWNEGMRALGRQGNWGQIEDSVIISQTLDVVPRIISDLLTKGHHQYMQMIGDFELSIADKLYRVGFVPLVGFIPLYDADEREVGDMVILNDVTTQAANVKSSIIKISLISMLVGVILLISFYLILKRLEQQLDSSHEMFPKESKTGHEYKKTTEQGVLEGYLSPARIVVATTVSIFIAELLVMVLLQVLPPLPPVVSVLFDSFLLIGLVSPALYYFLFRPLIIQISRREQAENDLQLFRNLIDQSNDVVVVIDPETSRFLDFNNKACSSLGYTRHELLLMGVVDIDVALPDNLSWDKHVREIRQNIDMVIDGIHKRKDGATFPVEISVKYIVHEGGGYIVAVARDITERKHAEEKLKTAYQTTRNILAKAPFGIYVVNENGIVEYVNPAMIKMAGNEYIQFKSLNTFDLPTYREIGLSEKIKGGLKGKYFKMEAVEYTSHFGQKTTIRNFIGIPLKEEGKHKLLMIVEDVTEAKKAEEALLKAQDVLEMRVEARTAELKEANIKLTEEISERKQAEEVLLMEKQRLDNVSNYANCGLFLLDDQTRITYANKFAEGWFGSLDKIAGKPCWKIFNLKDPENECAGMKVLRTGEMVRSDTYTELLHGEKKYFYVVASPVKDSSGRIHQISEIVIDITERKIVEKKLQEYQKKLRSLTSELSLAEELERRRIATDLHDYIGQSLAISKIKLGELQQEASSTENTKTLNEVHGFVDQAIKYTRSLMSDLSPPILYELGFEAAVEWLTENIYKQHGISCTFKSDKHSKPLDDAVRVVLFQAVRELLVNIAKHGKVSNAYVFVKKKNNNIQIDVRDDGVGFDTSKIGFYGDDTGGFGLFNIGERLDYLGGQLNIKSKPGKGTQVTLTAPLKGEGKITKKQITEEYVI